MSVHFPFYSMLMHEVTPKLVAMALNIANKV